MKNLKIIFFLLLITSCDKCCEILNLCDLLVDTLEAPKNITVGAVAEAIIKVANSEESGTDCTTDIAGLTTALLKVYKKNVANGNWDFVGENKKNQPELEAGKIVDLSQDIIYNEAGDYKMEFYTDDEDKIDERDENNNKDEDQGNGQKSNHLQKLQNTNNFSVVYLTVLPDKNGNETIKGVPVVEFVN